MSIRRGPSHPVRGYAAPGFEPVVHAFERNLLEHGELGAAFAATLDGRPVVDIWSGVADRRSGRNWDEDTLVLLFSGTKALVATCLLILIERGELDLTSPVARYWPEFGVQGKAKIQVADVVSHRARLPAIRSPIDETDLTNPQMLAEMLAQQAPERDPRCDLIYHGLTYGWLCGELVRRIDGRTIGKFFADEVAGPLNLKAWIGLPAEQLSQVAVMEYGLAWEHHPEARAAGITDELAEAIYSNPPLYPPDRVIWNNPSLQTNEIPAISGIGTPRSVARLLGCLARGGEIDGIRILKPETIELGRTQLARGPNVLSGHGPIAFAVGFQLQITSRPLGPPMDAFGHDGAGGSVLGAWPGPRAGFSYAMNLMRNDDRPDPRARNLLEALHECVL